MVSKPLYKQILDDLVEDIINGTYKENDQLPTELELSEKYNVSRITSKRALTELETIGLISRTRGKGSFVKKREADKVAKEPSKNILLIFPFLSEENTGLGEYTQGRRKYRFRRIYSRNFRRVTIKRLSVVSSN